MGAGHGQRLPRRDAGQPRRRGDPARDGQERRHVVRREPRRSARRRLPHRHAGRVRRPRREGDPAAVARRSGGGDGSRQGQHRDARPRAIRRSTRRKSWDVEWRRAEIPAAGGHGNARSVAIVQSIVSGLGQTHGQRFMSEAGRRADLRGAVLLRPTSCSACRCVSASATASRARRLPFPSPRTCFWGGWGGSLVINDLDNHMTVAYVMNKMGEGTVGDLRAASIIAGAYASLAS